MAQPEVATAKLTRSLSNPELGTIVPQTVPTGDRVAGNVIDKSLRRHNSEILLQRSENTASCLLEERQVEKASDIPEAPEIPDWLFLSAGTSGRGRSHPLIVVEPASLSSLGSPAMSLRRPVLPDEDDSVSDDYSIYMDDTCVICYDTLGLAPTGDMRSRRPCCRAVICSECMLQFVRSKVSDGFVNLPCPNSSCEGILSEDEVQKLLTTSERQRYERLKIIKDTSGNVHLCPNCSHITEAPSQRQRWQGTKVACAECSFEWCFECEAPWHEAKSCKENLKTGSKDFKQWLRSRVRDTPNAQRCPKCKIPIQRSSGCNNMTCSKCNTHFCYRCGGKQRDIFLIGSHYSRYSVVGCKYNLKPKHSVQRKAIRGSILFAGVTVGVPLCIAGGAVVIGGVVAISPFYGTYKLLKQIKSHV